MKLAWILCVSVLSLAACTQPNPDFCCSDPAECSALGVEDGLRTCASGKVCDSNICKAVECSTADECGADAPYCANQVCQPSCAGDGDCLGAAGPICADDGVCVGCRTNEDCSEAAPICDPVKRACAPCRADADCAETGVCLAADGVCAKPGGIVYVREDGVDVETCQDKAAPCRTIPFALRQVTPLRNVLRLMGSMYLADAEIVIDSKHVYIDAEGTSLRRLSAGRLMTFSGPSQVTLEGVKLSITSGSGIESRSSKPVRLSQISAIGTGFENALYVEEGEAKVSDSFFSGITLLCGRAMITVETSEFRGANIDGGGVCTGHVLRNKIFDTRVTVTGGLIFKNNLVVSTSPTCSNNFSGGAADEIDFNTWVCRRTPPMEDEFQGKAFACQPGMRSTGNLFAWDAVAPTRNCALRYSLLPQFATNAGGEGNVYSEMARVFVDYLGGDYHLSANSPARGAADPQADVTVDLEGNPRPAPKGSAPDIGAFEAR